MSLFPEVRSELVSLAERRAAVSPPRGWLRWFPRRSAGVLTIVVSTGCTAAVALVALLSLGGQHASVRPTHAGRSSVASLKTRLAVLRRPQTAADRAYVPVQLAQQVKGPVALVSSLTRLAATIQTPTVGRVEVLVIVRRLPSGSAPAAGSSAFGASVATVADRDHAHGASQGLPAAGLTAPGTIASGLRSGHASVNPNVGVTAQLVPDGVTRVKWTFTGAGYGVTHPHPVAVYAQVQANVAVAAIRSNQGPLQRSTWYGRNGHVIASAPGGQVPQQQLARIHLVNGGRTHPIAPVLLAHFGLFRSLTPVAAADDWQLPTNGRARDLNYSQTRYIPSVTGLDGRGLWITPGTHGLCISDPQAGACGKLPTLNGPGFVGIGIGGSRQETLSGLAPDGNRTVAFVLANGVTKTIPVVHNVYEATVPGHIVAIIDRNIAGRVERHNL
jgi:hypothetical protein